MKKFIHLYENPNLDRINYGLINHDYDGELIEYIADCCKSLEVLQYIKFLGYEYTDDESEIDTSSYIDARSRGKKKDKKMKYAHLKDSRCAELKLKFELSCKDKHAIITKKLLVPLPDRHGYYTIKGNQYFLMYQIVDNSTYTTKNTLTLKSSRPVSLKVKNVSYKCKTMKGTDGEEYSAPIYTMNLFGKETSLMLFYLAKTGLKTLEYFSVDKITRFVTTIEDTDKYVYFSISSKLYIEINKYFFEKYAYVRTTTFMLLSVMTNRMKLENLDNRDFWIEALGAIGTANKLKQYEKGQSTLMVLDRMIDETTKKILKTHDINKKNIYSLVRFMIANFNDLRKKDNLNLDNKRLRCNEYIASLLTRTFSDRVNRIISMGNKASMKDIRNIFKFPGDVILQQLHHSGLLKYDDRINDMDFFGKMKVTFKGPNSLGGNNDNNIAVKYRGVDPSYLGRLDINVCGTSDPGTSAVLTPFCKTSGLYFDSSSEPEEFKYILDKDIAETLGNNDNEVIVKPKYDSSKNYYDYLKGIEDMNSKFHVSVIPNKEKKYFIEINVEDDDEI